MKELQFAVNGSLMRGLELNINLLNVNAEFVKETTTIDKYRLWSINDKYPAMLRDLTNGKKISLELWKLSSVALLKVLEQEPPGLCIGKIELIDKRWVFGIMGEPYICRDQLEITKWGGWRNYLDNKFSSDHQSVLHGGNGIEFG